MIETTVVSLDNTRLNLVHNDNKNKPAIIFLHGACTSHKVWQYQLESSALNQQFHLIAPDLRGHGFSDKPRDESYYISSDHWAADLDAIITQLNVSSATLVAWSYGGRMVNDYLDYYGESRISGINFVAAGTLARDDVKGPGYQVLANLFSDDDETVSIAEQQFIRDLMTGVNDKRLYSALCEGVENSPRYVRDAMRQRTMHYEPVLAALTCQVLLTHGEQDQYSLPKLAHLLNAHIPNTTLSLYPNDGHLPFASNPERFNRELTQFVNR